MSVEPSTEKIDFFLSIAEGVSKADAVRWLKQHNNDVNSACNAFFENPNGLDAVWDNTTSQTWDDDAWGQGKEYGPQNQNQNIPSFTVNSDDILNPTPFEGTISRPPSRVSNLGLGDKPTGQNTQQNAKEREDAQLAKAIGMSLGNSDQESGVIDSSGTTFGPAKQPDYPPGDWTMINVGSRAQEILQNPEPQYRKRETGAPAFMRPSPAGNYLPPLITILHAVPMAREALLLRDCILPDYGHNNEWWDGLSIQTPKVVNLDEPDENTEWAEIIYETQRLMAFLDGTERAYGNVDALAHLDGVAFSHDAIEATFLKSWREAAEQVTLKSNLTDVFDSTACFAGEPNKTFSVIDLATPVESDPGFSIYDSFDDAFYYGLRHTDECYLERVADVLVIHLNRGSTSLSGHGMRVPSIFYPDRYLKEALDMSTQMRASKEAIKEEVESIEEVQTSMTKLQDSWQEVDATKLLTITKAYLQSPPTIIDSDETSFESGDSAFFNSNAEKAAAYSKLAEGLQAVADLIQRKFEVLEDSKAQKLEKLRNVSKILTKPSADPDTSPKHKYTLRGVSTKHNTTYVLERTRPEDEDDLLSAEASDWQWWKITFSPGNTKPVTYTKVREVEVMKAAKDESATALLVYASEKAVSFETKPPPQQLCNFVRMDNLEFDAELDRATSIQGLTSPKRKSEEMTDDMDVINWGGYQSNSPKTVNGFSTSESAEDTNDALPPPYTPSKPPAPPPRSAFSRSSAYKSRNHPSYDDMIPTSLRATGPTIDSSSTSLEDVEMIDAPAEQEMRERVNGLGMKSSVGSAGNGGTSEYELGSYVPDINMDDMDDEGYVEGPFEGKGG